MLKEYFKSIEDVSATEWLLCMLIAIMAAMLSIVSRDDPEHPHLSPIFAGQSCYYWFRSIMPVCAFLRAKMAEEFPKEDEPAEAPATEEA